MAPVTWSHQAQSRLQCHLLSIWPHILAARGVKLVRDFCNSLWISSRSLVLEVGGCNMLQLRPKRGTLHDCTSFDCCPGQAQRQPVKGSRHVAFSLGLLGVQILQQSLHCNRVSYESSPRVTVCRPSGKATPSKLWLKLSNIGHLGQYSQIEMPYVRGPLVSGMFLVR